MQQFCNAYFLLKDGLFYTFARKEHLIVLDNSIVENSQDKLANIDANKQTFSKKELATILGVKPKQIKAYMILKGNDATAIWGMRGFNGVLDVYSPKHYKQLKKEGKLDTRLQLAK